MDEKSLIFGVSYAVDGLIMALLKQNIDLNIEEDYYVNISPPPIPDSTDFGDSVISGIFVDLTEDVVTAILGVVSRTKKGTHGKSKTENQHQRKPLQHKCSQYGDNKGRPERMF